MSIENTREYLRLQSDESAWRRWGPYLSNRQWSTEREDDDAAKDPWNAFTYEEARWKAYQWGEDGIFGISDNRQRLCFALALWNHNDEHIKERFFGLPGLFGPSQGNHCEDVKEYYFYLDNTPTHSYMKALYKYPIREFPYKQLQHENDRRTRDDPEFELVDTGIFNEDLYFDVEVEYAKADRDDILIRITAIDRSSISETHLLTLLPTIWFSKLWERKRELIPGDPKFQGDGEKSWNPVLRHYKSTDPSYATIEASNGSSPFEDFSKMWLYCDKAKEYDVIFVNNDTPRGGEEGFWKNGIDEHLIKCDACKAGRECKDYRYVNPKEGTKGSIRYRLALTGGQSKAIRLRLSKYGPSEIDPFVDFDDTFRECKKEADDFYRALTPFPLDDKPEIEADMRSVQRQALAGLLWNKQFYYYPVKEWCETYEVEDKPKHRKHALTREWGHLYQEDIISMPDKWEYPYYAAWDVACHAVSFSLIDPKFAKDQLLLFTSPWYMSPEGKIPAHEFNFDEVNPPIFAWAAWKVYKNEAVATARPPDRAFLKRIFENLLAHLNWWLSSKRIKGRHLFGGGFLGLDNISIIDRNQFQTDEVRIEQVDATAWVGMFCLNMLRIAVELSQGEDASVREMYKDLALKLFIEFLQIAEELNRDQIAEKPNRECDKNGVHTVRNKTEVGLWNGKDGFYYEVLRIDVPNFLLELPLEYRSLLGLIPIFGVAMIESDPEKGSLLLYLKDRLEKPQKRLAQFRIHGKYQPLFGPKANVYFGKESNYMYLSLVSPTKLEKLLSRVLERSEFNGKFGIRSLSKCYERPWELNGVVRNKWNDYLGIEMKYEPGETAAGIHTGNSNWRGPVWFPVNYLLIDALREFHRYFKECEPNRDFKVSDRSASLVPMSLDKIAASLSRNLISIFLRGADGNRPVFGCCAERETETRKIFAKEHWNEYMLFHEYFHGEDGTGLGASHQTGWTALVANLIQELGEYSKEEKQEREEQPNRVEDSANS